MKVDVKLRAAWFDDITAAVDRAEEQGYDGLWSAESAHDPFLPLMVAAQRARSLELGTAIAVAFARNPMSLAYTAHDLSRYCDGRFVLGLGSQVRPHIERRFGMPWSSPAARMRELILALRAIWQAWQTGDRLAFDGEFYRHTLMTPFFSPDPLPAGPPPVHLAAVGERMTEVAGEVADGLIAHAFTTSRYLVERTLPALERGRARAAAGEKSLAPPVPRPFEISLPCLIATGSDAAALETATAATRAQIAFYGSTPAYRGVLELHGWAALADDLNRLSRRDDPNRWQQMAELVDDDVLAAFAVVGEPEQVGTEIGARFAGVVDRISFYTPYAADPADLSQVLASVRAGTSSQLVTAP